MINNNDSKIMQQIKEKKCYNIDCSENWKLNQKKIISEINGCECELNNCLSCPLFDLLDKKICTDCNNNYYPIENESYYAEEYYNCYKYPKKGYFLDNNTSLFKKCYHTCKTCEIGGNYYTHNCLECNDNYNFSIIINNSFNCYEKCDNYYYFDNEYNYHCTNDKSCPDDFPKLINFECIRYDFNNLMEEILNIKTNETKFENKEGEIYYYDNIINTIERIFISENYGK